MAAPDAQNALVQMRDEVLDTIDHEITPSLIERWLNREIERLAIKKEWTFFWVKTSLTTVDNSGVITLELPASVKKVSELFTGSELERVSYFEGKNYDSSWNATRGAWDLLFYKGSAGIVFNLKYYARPSRLLEEETVTRFPEYYVSCIIDGVLVRAYEKLDDLQESQSAMLRYRSQVKDAIDEDARSGNLPSQMSPNQGMTQKGYNQNFADQRDGGYPETTYAYNYYS